MNLGEIYLWVTNQAIGYESRRKYHIYLCDAGWRVDGHAFLFISKTNYGGDYPIKSSDYRFLPLETSYVSCNNIITYSESELQKLDQQPLGVLSKKHMVELFNFIAGSDTMEQWQIDLACKALKAVF
jgi:hypothetical protein